MNLPIPPSRLSVNLSLVYGHLPVRDRPAAAAAAGFTAVEMWWPFDTATPSDAAVDDLLDDLRDAGTQLVLLNLREGNTLGGDRGLLSIPAEKERVIANITVAMAVAEAAGCHMVNALYGNRLPGMDPTVQDAVAMDNFDLLLHLAESAQVTVLLETLNSVDSPRYPFVHLATTAQLLGIVRQRTGQDNVGLLVDVYHLAQMKADIPAVLWAVGDLINHVQLADLPGRGRPGTGSIDFGSVLATLSAIGYTGRLGLEYQADVSVSRGSSEPIISSAADFSRRFEELLAASAAPACPSTDGYPLNGSMNSTAGHERLTVSPREASQ